MRDDAALARNLARDYMPPADWLELRQAEKAFYEKMAKQRGGAAKVPSILFREVTHSMYSVGRDTY